ncbi:Flavin-dependent oxidoreductase, luciferase family (includes alkanesulfonate monooxygenase SsuD and methylene tetrahydromethanopterin reductase) [Alteribacillus persepolensis]|uniref:Flavin-dependent oxidoreductase, luciferase family (Includes alkanesulfonate monooxygenase SsuD and methylene tetrahydromethanopterin reductase) n=1 Tax=Alteribacillus persepolensis TaxID=568899 RepID=A0A1G8GY94_9BACI|nr:LLM class flavin-dependent oxidoreductase [Alteribacillus persepolensis]SDH99319.1 Flavin-dependent oxidoreductase, luciferase family (includes alkanesulfonate monooxygenase SsuD and methylene tetrahydromethanopterin reductase) [Alteribacillus persepolensis]
MKFGYFTLTDNPIEYGDTRKDPNQMVKDLIEQCVYAEDLGFNSVWVPEHHFSVLGVLPSPSMLLSYVAAKTSKVKLAPATVLLPANHPIRMAEEYALLDLVSDGRAIFSAGRGYDKREYDVFQVDFNKSREIFYEQLDIIKKAWTQDSLSYDGEFFKFPEVELTPKPVQDPHPPIYVASFSESSALKAAEMGENVIYAPFAANMVFGSIHNAVKTFKDKSAEHGFSGKEARCSYFLNVTESKEETEKTKQRMLKYFTGLVPAFPSDPSTAPPNIRYFADIVERLKTMKAEDLGDQSIIVGDSEYVIQKLKEVEESGIEEVIIYFDFGGLSHKETMESMERFARDVLPHFEDSNIKVEATNA